MIACFDLLGNKWYRIPNVEENVNLLKAHFAEFGTNNPEHYFPATSLLGKMFAEMIPSHDDLQDDITCACIIRFEW